MRFTRRHGTTLGLLAALLLTGSVHAAAQHGPAGQSKTGAAANVDWPRFGNTADNTRFSSLAQVNDSNVGQLGLAWTMAEDPNTAIWETDPVVVNGVMYLTTNIDQVRAVNAATGALLWQYTPKVDFYHAIAGGGGGVPTNRGVAVAQGRVYLLTFDDQLIALQATTGEKLWSSRVADSNAGYSETSPPTYWNGLLIVGSAESDAGLRGFVAAFDATSGKQVWRFYTVPAPGQGWMPAAGSHGGGDVWMPPTVDTTTGIVYVGTGNPSPDLDNSDRPGCNPWVDAIVALDARTGKFIWAHSELCNDVWDLDSQQPPFLFNMTVNGKTVRAVGHTNKTGLYFTYDALTGKILAKSTYLGGGRGSRPRPTLAGVKTCSTLSIEFTPGAYNPALRYTYEPGINDCAIYKLAPKGEANRHAPGAADYGGSFTPVGHSTGYMAAVDVTTGTRVWKDPMPAQMIGGALATAGNLVFSGCDDTNFYAFNATNGTILWKAHLGLAFGAAPITYAVNGTQYIAIAAGGSALATSHTGGELAVFKLHGKPITPFTPVTAGLIPNKIEAPSLKGLTKINPWMYVDAKARRVVLNIVAAATAENSGFNFDGYANGKANFIVPAGWEVDWVFVNKQALPHSAAIASSLKPGAPLPLVAGYVPVSTPLNGVQGAPANQTIYTGFNLVSVGNYYLVCLVPGHIQSGMWDHFTISATAKLPSIVVTK